MAFDKRPKKIILANEKMKRAYRDYLHHADGKLITFMEGLFDIEPSLFN